jgi:hypothetical protein
MMRRNLLDLDNDVLNIIGGYVKEYKLEIMKKEEQKFKQDVFKYVDLDIKKTKRCKIFKKIILSRYETRNSIWLAFVEFCNHRFGIRYMDDNDTLFEITKF